MLPPLTTGGAAPATSARSRVLILDFGSQYTQLIARRIRELHLYSEVHPYDWPVESVRTFDPGAIVFSGSPGSATGGEPYRPAQGVLDLDIPILGICYGMQIVSQLLGGEVTPSNRREYGTSTLAFAASDGLFRGTQEPFQAWMSHGDSVTRLPAGFRALARTEDCPLAAAIHPERRIALLQFHPEVAHTPQGAIVLRNFFFDVASLTPGWTMEAFVDRAVREVREKVGDRHAVCGLSGGVDSSVAATLVSRAMGDRLTCLFVDHGLLRKNETTEVLELLRGEAHLKIVPIDASDRFLRRLEGVADPEEKRRVIGHEFIAVFEEEAKRLGTVDFLVQGTLYPDVIESVSTRGPSCTIKTHHNVGGLPEKMRLALLEPLRQLFKDEVREVGRVLGLSQTILGRHPFPGPGLAVRILGDVTRERVSVLQEADAIFLEELRRRNLYDQVWQAFVVLLPVRSVGVMGDERTYENVAALRAVRSVDGMTASWAELPYDALARISSRIVNEVRGINRVVYDVSSKPPATIEWE